MSNNPLLSRAALPRIEAVQASDVMPAVEQVLGNNREAIAQLVADIAQPRWDNLVQPLEELGERLHDCWSVVSHLHGVCNGEELRAAYDEVLPALTAYSTELGQNTGLYAAYRAIAQSPAYTELDAARRQSVEHALRDFRLSGVALAEEQKQRFAELQQEMAKLSTAFSNNVLDATQGWYLHLPDAERLEGVPAAVLGTLAQQAQVKKLDGYVVTLDIPCYLPVMQHAADRELRKELYEAYSTRASEQGPNAGRWDNGEVMDKILAIRHEMATLLGFGNYAELSLATKMAATPSQVMDFLQELAAKSRPVARQEFEDLQAFASEQGAPGLLEAWDVPYYSELLRQHRYAISEQELRPYFPAPRVIAGMFEVVGRLFGVDIAPDPGVPLYHPDVSFYWVSREGERLAGFYLDPYARENKRGGAWMADCRNRFRDTDGELHLPIAFLTCNFSPPGGEAGADAPSLLTHSEVTTLFHEFGHGLHHMLTRVEVASVSGINGVAWDAVELPSQFLENWCWHKEALDLISGHFETGEPLPEALLDKMLAARNFQSGMLMVRQLEFALFDFRLHLEYQAGATADIQGVLDAVREEVAVVPVPAFNRFQHGFSHIFAGGYAAGYYSYKWAEVLSADAFARFEEEGIFNDATGASFLHEILECGGAREPAEAFRAFRGRDPDSTALLRHSGII